MSLDPERVDKLENQARMLAVGHYVVGGLVMLFSLFALLYVAMGVVFVVAPIPTQAGEPPPALFGGIFIAVGLLVGAFVLALGIANFVAGINLGRRRGRMMILVVAILNLLHQPFGLILGILTLLYIVQSDVKEYFEGETDPDLLV